VNIPDIYHKFVEEKCDVVIGSRYVKGGISNDALSSQIMSHMLNFAFRVCLGLKANDLSTDYRMYRTKQLKRVKLTCDNYDVLEEVLLRLKLNKKDKNLKIGEVPINFEKRMYGESKRQLVKYIISYIKTLVKLTWLRITDAVKH
jgi:dolichol-phosphate mannosyltransferase